MILFFSAVAALILLVGVFLAAPLFRRPDAPQAEQPSLADRLRAIDRAIETGFLSDQEAAEARLEAQRAALAAPMLDTQPSKARGWRMAAIVFLALAPLLAAAIYGEVGAPTLIAAAPAIAPPTTNPADIAALPEAERAAMIEAMVDGLKSRLQTTPLDAEGWRMLARSELVLGRASDAAGSYRRLFEVVDGDLEDWRNYAGALIAQSGERFPVGDGFIVALDEIEKRAPGDPMALFYRGGASYAKGDGVGAVAAWSALLGRMPADAPVRPTLEGLIEEARGLAAAPSRNETP